MGCLFIMKLDVLEGMGKMLGREESKGKLFQERNCI